MDLRVKGEVSRIPSKVYYRIFEEGGDPLVALFCILKRSKQSEKFESYVNTKGRLVGGYGLLRKNTNISLNTLKRYCKPLAKLGLIEFCSNGDVYIKGTNKLIEEYKNRKLVPVKIGGSFKNTQYNSFSVRLHACKDNQLRQIEKKHIQNEKYSKGVDPKNYEELGYYKDIQKRNLRAVSVNDTVVLSNESYYRLKGGTRNTHQKSRGSYWKNKLKDKGLIKTERRFEKVCKMNFKEFKFFRKNSDDLNIGKYRFGGGHLLIEVVSKFDAVDSVNKTDKPKEKPKPIPMDFDFIGWLKDNPEVNKDRKQNPLGS